MISVIGAGAFGTALAIAIARGGTPVSLWARNSDDVKAMQSTGRARRLPGVELPDLIRPETDLKKATQADTILLAVPMQQLRGFLTEHTNLFKGKTLVACCKGIDLKTLEGPSDLIRHHVQDATPAVLTGPSFAADIAQGLPTALTLACQNDAVGKALQNTLSTPVLRLYRSTDTQGAELGGALKNVIAIACGITVGRGLGESARAAVMTRGFAEMTRFATALGGQAETLGGLSGLRDLVLTSTTDKSRNMRYGLALGQGAEFDPSITVEGADTARAVAKIAQDRNLQMPLTCTVAQTLDQSLSVDEAVTNLLSRPLRKE